MACDRRPSRLDEYLVRVSTVVADRMGLHFPPERFGDLARGLTSAAHDRGVEDVAEYARQLVSARLTAAELQCLASHLTIGETYFFRDPATWKALRQSVLPALIESRRRSHRRLRLWSAACASGEEAFSLAILLYELLPDVRTWDVTILATDINPRLLAKGRAGIYGAWSFRGTSEQMTTQYFTRTGKGQYSIRDEFRRLVRFEHMNLVEDTVPSLLTESHAMDVILCRNALMYFTPAQMENAVGTLHRSLVEDGWLVVSPSEAAHARFPQFAVTNFPDAVVFRKQPARRPVASASRGATPPPGWSGARMAAGGAARLDSPLQVTPRTDCSAQVRALADQGRLADALTACDRWILSDRLCAPAHYLRGMILLEQADYAAARLSLQRALYLDQRLLLAHVALGSVSRARGDHEAAARHLANAQRLLAEVPPDAILPDADGLTAGRLAGMLSVLLGTGPRA